MQTLKRRRLSWKLRLFLVLLFFLLAFMRIAILTIPFRILAKLFLQPKTSSCSSKLAPEKHAIYARIIGRMTALVARYTPWQSKCLVQALACRLLLRHYTIANIFYLGVGKDEANKFTAHAWINCLDETIVGGSSSFERYKIISQFEDI